MNLRAAGTFVGCVLLIWAQSVWSCTCQPYDDLKQAVQGAWDRADAIFSGRVLEHRPSPEAPDVRVRTTFAVTRRWKGAAGDTMHLKGAASSAECGCQFLVGREYLVFAYRSSDGSYTTNICTYTRNLENASEIISIVEDLASSNNALEQTRERQKCRHPEHSSALLNADVRRHTRRSSSFQADLTPCGPG